MLIAENYTNAYNPGGALQVYIGKSDFADTHAEPAYSGSMEVVDRIGDRVLLYNPLTGHYWDRRPRHGSWGVAATRDPEARRIFRERRW